MVYKIGLERHTKFEFAGMMDTTSLYHCSKFKLCVQFLETFMSNYQVYLRTLICMQVTYAYLDCYVS